MIQATELTGKLALDGRGLDALRLQAKQDPEQAAKGVARQFEAVFLQTLLKSMRDATPQDGLMESDQTRMYTSMLDQQLSQTLSAKGIGLADVMLRQLTSNRAAVVGAEPQGKAEVIKPFSERLDALPAELKDLPMRNAPASLPAPLKPGRVKAGVAGQDPVREFLSNMKEHALQASTATGIPARFLLGHAALESGWGKHEIRTADGGQSFNLFGIKAGRNWKGQTVDVMTTEYVNGAPRRLMQKFRAYGSYAEAFQDYAGLMQGNQRYAAVLKQNDGAAFAKGLQRAGYATDPQYADKLTRVLNSSVLRQLAA